MKDNFTYPVILDFNEDGFINIHFPQFEGAFTCVEMGENFVSAAQEVLALCIQDYLNMGKKLPKESVILSIEEGQKVVYINVWMPYHRKSIKETYVKKTLTIPTWLDMLAKENHINFSAVLVEGLKEKLGIYK